MLNEFSRLKLPSDVKKHLWIKQRNLKINTE